MANFLDEKIDVVRVVIERVGACAAKASVTSMDAANHLLQTWCATTPQTGLDQCAFFIVFEDGKTFTGQYDLLPYTENFQNLSQQIRGSLQYVLGKRRPKGVPKVRYQELVGSFDPCLVEQAKRVLNCYEI